MQKIEPTAEELLVTLRNAAIAMRAAQTKAALACDALARFERGLDALQWGLRVNVPIDGEHILEYEPLADRAGGVRGLLVRRTQVPYTCEHFSAAHHTLQALAAHGLPKLVVELNAMAQNASNFAVRAVASGRVAVEALEGLARALPEETR